SGVRWGERGEPLARWGALSRHACHAIKDHELVPKSLVGIHQQPILIAVSPPAVWSLFGKDKARKCELSTLVERDAVKHWLARTPAASRVIDLGDPGAWPQRGKRPVGYGDRLLLRTEEHTGTVERAAAA